METTNGKARGGGPREALHRTRAFVFCALAGDMMFFVVLVTLFYARQVGTRMDPETFRQIGDWHPILLPPILFLNTAVLLLSSLTMERARQHIFREFDVLEEWLGLGRPGSAPHPALGRRHAGPGAALPDRADHSLEAIDRAGLCFRSLGHARKLFLLRHHGIARRPPRSGPRRFAVLPLRAHSAQAGRIPPDRRRLDRMVLARHGPRVAGAVRSSRAGTVEKQLLAASFWLPACNPRRSRRIVTPASRPGPPRNDG